MKSKKKKKVSAEWSSIGRGVGQQPGAKKKNNSNSKVRGGGVWQRSESVGDG